MRFVWRDRDGDDHELDAPQAILAEVERISLEIDRLVAVLENPDIWIRNTARGAVARLRKRLAELAGDMARWNDHAAERNRRAAAELVGAIDGLGPKLADTKLVVELHAEREALEATAGGAESREALIAGRPTELQRRAVRTTGSRTPPSPDANRGEVQAWLDRQPRFARPTDAGAGWFAWADRHGAAHRLASPLAIEREVVEVEAALRASRPTLLSDTDAAVLFEAVEEARRWWDRLIILQRDLTRFDQEEAARDLEECRRWAADWRSKRGR